ncbi:MAG: sugar ABC transporter substrate-binding protein [Christensenella sp.]
MLKKTLVTLVAILLCVSMVACGAPAAPAASSAPAASEAPAAEASKPAEEAAPAGDFVKAADIKAPSGKTSLSLPVDQVAEKPLKIATIMVQNNPFGAAVLVGQNWAKEVLADRNCTVDCLSVEDFDPQKWSSVLENCIASGYDAITYFGLSEALQPVVDKGVDAGILMYAFNTEPGTNSKRQAYYGQDGDFGGQECGKKLEELMGGEGEYAIITGDFAVLGHELRRKGAHKILDANTKLKMVAEVENNDKAEEAYTQTVNILTANPNLKGLYVTAGGPSGAAKALQDQGMADKVQLVCHDVLAESAPYIADGTIKGCMDQDPFNQGAQPVIDAFNMLVAKKAPAEEINWYKGVMATPADVKELFPELFK